MTGKSGIEHGIHTLQRKLHNVQGAVQEAARIPTDVEWAYQFKNRWLVELPCSLTKHPRAVWADMAEAGDLKIITLNHEHAMAGVTSGIYLGTGEVAINFMQNSGFPNFTDGALTLVKTFGLPQLAVVTQRGQEGDDSEPHQETAKAVPAFYRKLYPQRNIHQAFHNHGLHTATERAIAQAEAGKRSLLLVSEGDFENTYPLRDIDVEYEHPNDRKRRKERILAKKGTDYEKFYSSEAISRAEAYLSIEEQFPEDAYFFGNGFLPRVAIHTKDRILNFYGVGYMGGALAMGYGFAKSNPHLRAIVIDGDWNASMSTMKDILSTDYPDNLEWFTLDNHIGESIGTAISPELDSVFDLAHVIKIAREDPNTYKVPPRVKGSGRYIDMEIGSLPDLAIRFMLGARTAKEAKIRKDLIPTPFLEGASR